MKFTREEVFAICELTAPGYKLSPLLVYAICLQEGQRDGEGKFDPTVARLEQGFYRRYTMPQSRPTTTEVLLAASYGVMQCLGQSLWEMKYFEAHFDQMDRDTRSHWGVWENPLNVCDAINTLTHSLDLQISYGCRWLDVKRRMANGDEGRMLDLWNGDMSGGYRAEVLQKLDKVRKGYR